MAALALLCDMALTVTLTFKLTLIYGLIWAEPGSSRRKTRIYRLCKLQFKAFQESDIFGEFNYYWPLFEQMTQKERKTLNETDHNCGMM